MLDASDSSKPRAIGSVVLCLHPVESQVILGIRVGPYSSRAFSLSRFLLHCDLPVLTAASACPLARGSLDFLGRAQSRSF